MALVQEILVIPQKGRYNWHPVLMAVAFTPWREQQPTIDFALTLKNNTRKGALKCSLKHALRESNK